MKWIKSLTRELPFHTWENWQYTYFNEWYNLLGFGLKNVVYYSQNNVVAIYRVKKEWDDFIANMKGLCLKKPEIIMGYYKELVRLDKILIELENRDIKTKEELKSYIQEIKKLMGHYSAVYLIKLYSNMAMDDEVVKKQPELVKRARSLVMRAEWFELCQAIIKKINEILKLPVHIAASINFDEIINYIDTGYVDYKLAEKRYNKVTYDLTKKRYYFGKEADEHIKKLYVVEEEVEKSDILKGIIANKGKAKGPVIIALGSGDFSKIKKGCILIAHMTTPWYIPYMSKVKAIVTDEGGIGCHASIMARELKIPCVIGTKIATKVFKDGDLVEVDADKGVVRKIK